MTGTLTLAVVAVVALLWSWSWARGKLWLRPLAWQLAPHRWALFGVTTAMTLTFTVGGKHYAAIQRAPNVIRLDALVGGDLARYRGFAAFDVLYAVVYGLLGLSLVPVVRKWQGEQPIERLLRRIGSVGCGLFVAGAAFDILENLQLLWILFDDKLDIGGSQKLVPDLVERGNRFVQTMTTVGSVKWGLIALGAVVVFVVFAVRVLTFPGTRDWIAPIRRPYAVYLGLTVGFVGAAAAHQRWLFWLLVPAMLVCGSWLNSLAPAFVPGSSDKALAGIRLPLVQLGAAIIVIIGGTALGGIAGDVAFVLGAALVVLSLGALVTEARHRFGSGTIGAVLLRSAVGLVVLLWVLDLIGLLPLQPLLGLTAVAVLLGEVATEVTAEKFQLDHAGDPASAVHHRALLSAGGLVVVSIAGVVLLVVAGHVDPWQAGGLMAFLVMVVWMASIDGDALVVVALLGLLLVASTRPTERSADENVLAQPDTPYMLVLGDSYTSGEGATSYLPGTNDVLHDPPTPDPHTNECRRATTAWPLLLAKEVHDHGLRATDDPTTDDQAFPSRVVFLACSGDVTENIRATPRRDEHQRRQGADQLGVFRQTKRELGTGPSVVIVGIGGNDAGFGDVVSTCIGPGNCAEVADEFLEVRHDHLGAQKAGGNPVALRSITKDLQDTYLAIRDEVGDDVPIVATSYPSPVTVDGSCSGALLSKPERRFIAGFAERLNETIQQAATSSPAKVSFMDISTALSENGMQLCAGAPGRAGLNFLAFGSKGGSVRDSLNPKNWAHNSAHPNARGHGVLAVEAQKALASAWPIDPRHPIVMKPSKPTSSVTVPVVKQANPRECYVGEPTQDQSKALGCETIGTWQQHETERLYLRAVLLLAAILFALRWAFLGLVAAGRYHQVHTFTFLKQRWSEI